MIRKTGNRNVQKNQNPSIRQDFDAHQSVSSPNWTPFLDKSGRSRTKLKRVFTKDLTFSPALDTEHAFKFFKAELLKLSLFLRSIGKK